MGRSILEPDLLLRNIHTKKRQLGEIEQDLKNLPYDRPERHRLLERMLHLQQGIPELEAEYANRTEVPSKAVAVAANLTKKSPENKLHRFSSPLREAVAYFIRTNENSSDQEILAYLRGNHPKLIPPSWEQDQKLAADTFTKVRRVLRDEGQKRVNSHLPATSGRVTAR
jgi:hypothetical protein